MRRTARGTEPGGRRELLRASAWAAAGLLALALGGHLLFPVADLLWLALLILAVLAVPQALLVDAREGREGAKRKPRR